MASLFDDILTALGDRVVQRKANGEITIWCPFHADGEGTPPHNPNLLIKPGSKGASYVWGCAVCNIGGTLLQLADRLRQLLAPTVRRRMGEAARQLALRHTLDSNCEQIVTIYYEIAARQRCAA